MTKTLRVRTRTGWTTKPAPDLDENRLTAEEIDDNFLALDTDISTHTTSHPAPTNRDERNDPAGAASAVQGNLDTHTGLTTTAHGGLVASTDSRLADARTPTVHKASHETGGSDALTPGDIGAATTGHDHDTDYDALGAAATVAGNLTTHEGLTTTAHGGLVPSGDVATTPTANKIPKSGTDGTIDIRWIGLPLEAAGAYGVRWNPHDDTYMELGASNGSPAQESMRRVLLKDADATIDTALPGGGVLKSTDSTKFANDADASGHINGANGHQVMVEIPMCYTNISVDARGHHYFWCSATPLPGLSLDPAFMVGPGGNVVRSARYVGAYQSVRYVDASSTYADGTGATRPADLTNDHVGSVSGFIPHTNQYRSEDRTLIENIGGSGVYWLQDYWLHRLVQLLYLTDKATRSSVHPFNSQAVLPGHTEDGSWSFAKVRANGLTNSLGNASGSVGTAGSGVAANSFRGIENFYGSVWTWFDGFLKSPSYAAWASTDPTQFTDKAEADADVGPAGYSLIVDQYGKPIQLPGANEYQKHLWPGTLLPSVVGSGADAATYITDYYWQSPGWRVAGSGGFLHGGSRAGFAAHGVHSSSVDAYAGIGSRSSA